MRKSKVFRKRIDSLNYLHILFENKRIHSAGWVNPGDEVDWIKYQNYMSKTNKIGGRITLLKKQRKRDTYDYE